MSIAFIFLGFLNIILILKPKKILTIRIFFKLYYKCQFIVKMGDFKLWPYAETNAECFEDKKGLWTKVAIRKKVLMYSK